MSDVFANPLWELKEFEDLDGDLKAGKGPVQVSGCMDSQKVHLMYEAAKETPWKLVVTGDGTKAQEIYDDFRYFEPNTWLYPAKDLLFYSADIHGNLMVKQRLQVLRHLMEDERGVVVTTLDGLMDHLLPLDFFRAQALTVECGQDLDLEEWREKLVALGYERLPQVDGMGQFSIRGGILDIFPLTEEMPVRIELWDTEVDSIRTFDLESQRSVEQMDRVTIYPASEMVLTKERIAEGVRRIEKEEKKYEKALRDQMKTEEAHRIKTQIKEVVDGLKEGWGIHGLDSFLQYFYDDTVSFLDYFPQGGTVIFLDEPARLQEKGDAVELEFRESMGHRLEHGYILPGQADLLYGVKEVLARAQTGRTVCLTALEQKLAGISVQNKYHIDARNISSYQTSFDMLIKDLKRWKKEKYRVILLSGSRTRASRLAGDLREYELSAFCPDDPERQVQPGEILVTYGNLHRGFEYPMIKFIVLTEGDMFGAEKKKKRRKTAYEGRKIQSFAELSVGDYVVHEDHGLGIYRGIEKIERDKVVKDYIKIRYAGSDMLFVPVTQLDLVTKYIGGKEDSVVKLNKLNSAEWAKTRARVKKAVKDMADELIKLYAKREAAQGYAFGPDTDWQNDFERRFPYDETDDQLRCIREIKDDMEKPSPMDRLLCGDVGFGKTEVAIRAAFKCVMDGKQCAVLVPTTILAWQHYQTFRKRMEGFPVKVDILSRFRTPREQEQVLEELRRGQVDIVVGTHRLVQKDVKFKDLGLCIIDEEQRFGVKHKESFKEMRNNVDVLTLSATPIPRTLNMAMSGIRDMSTIEEAPQDRQPVQTYVMEHDWGILVQAISKELRRGGQVFYLHNRVDTIDRCAATIQQFLPDATVVVAHGKMSEEQLSKVWKRLLDHEIDILVCTTIIETGVDVSNCNTLIIEDADRLGLSQLYQIRGRVGRSSRRAFAYLTVTKGKALTDVATKRLEAIREFTTFGSGFRIAMRDLEIRGAGNILGAQQHGHMEAVGYEMYLKMLSEAVAVAKGEKPEVQNTECLVDIRIGAHIPEDYIESLPQRIDIYKKIASVENEKDASDIIDELIDRFGTPPEAVKGLVDVSLLRNMAAGLGIREISQRTDSLLFYPETVDMQAASRLAAGLKGRVMLNAGAKPYLAVKVAKGEKPVDTMRLALTMMAGEAPPAK